MSPDALQGRVLPLAMLLTSLSVVACGDEAGAPAPSPGPVDVTYEAGPFMVEAGSELVMCTFIKADNEVAQDVSRLRTRQSEGGHHLVIYTVDHAIDLPPTPCNQGGQPGWNQILVSQLNEEEQILPEGVGFQLAPRQQLVLETHYVNSTATPFEASSAVSFTYAPAGTVKERAASYFIGSFNIDIPPNASWSTDVTCKVPDPINLFTLFGHEHRRGTGVRATLRAAGQEERTLYETKDWDAPPIEIFDEGLAVSSTDEIQVHCDWDNPGADRLRYPHEMCFAVGMYWPSKGTLMCAAGGGKDDCLCWYMGTIDTGPGGSTVELQVSRAEDVAGTIGDPASGAPIFCSLWKEEDWAGFGPKAGATPYYMTEAIDVRLEDTSAKATLTFHDVTPGDYVSFCLMDTIGGGGMPGKGDLIHLEAPRVSPVAGQTARADVVLDLAVP